MHTFRFYQSLTVRDPCYFNENNLKLTVESTNLNDMIQQLWTNVTYKQVVLDMYHIKDREYVSVYHYANGKVYICFQDYWHLDKHVFIKQAEPITMEYKKILPLEWDEQMFRFIFM